jgi:hypothetical protein
MLDHLRPRRHDFDGSAERHRGQEAEEVPADPDEEEGSGVPFFTLSISIESGFFGKFLSKNYSKI